MIQIQAWQVDFRLLVRTDKLKGIRKLYTDILIFFRILVISY